MKEKIRSCQVTERRHYSCVALTVCWREGPVFVTGSIGIHEWKIGRKVWGKYFADDCFLSLCRLYESRVYIRITYWFPIIAGKVHWRLLWNSWIAAYKNYIYLLEDVLPFVIRRLNKCASYFSSYRLSIIVHLAVTTIHPSLGNCWTCIDTCWKKMSHWSFSTTHSLSQVPPY